MAKVTRKLQHQNVQDGRFVKATDVLTGMPFYGRYFGGIACPERCYIEVVSMKDPTGYCLIGLFKKYTTVEVGSW